MTPRSPPEANSGLSPARLQRLGYRLLPSQVPRPPGNRLFVETLRWCVAVLDAGHPDIAEATRLLDKAIRRPGLMPPEARRAEAVFERTRETWARSGLAFQEPLDLSNVVALAKPASSVAPADQPDLFEAKRHG